MWRNTANMAIKCHVVARDKTDRKSSLVSRIILDDFTRSTLLQGPVVLIILALFPRASGTVRVH